ncbi:hypothetical protein HY612_01610 [Candidatus Roizmanbacteria bacterium]|nr:hypothetical protein [Candidatus Roizmanbacteria bacterium]
MTERSIYFAQHVYRGSVYDKAPSRRPFDRRIIESKGCIGLKALLDGVKRLNRLNEDQILTLETQVEIVRQLILKLLSEGGVITRDGHILQTSLAGLPDNLIKYIEENQIVDMNAGDLAKNFGFNLQDKNALPEKDPEQRVNLTPKTYLVLVCPVSDEQLVPRKNYAPKLQYPLAIETIDGSLTPLSGFIDAMANFTSRLFRQTKITAFPVKPSQKAVVNQIICDLYAESNPPRLK